ncbi:MAG: DUF91 domain-containing protein [Deltaproteobacteria bacterium]|nr:MAG: DUF91 domain-containing protein [Deltaproteobacteria bacterium]
MICKRCTTRFDNTKGICPHCGHMTGSLKPGSTSSDIGELTSQPKAEAAPKADAAPKDAPAPKDDASRKQTPAAGADAPDPEPEPAPPAEAPKPRSPSSERAKHPGPRGSSPPTASPVFDLQPEEVRVLLAEHPELLEEGLATFTDKKGKPVGAGYAAADVGEIDVLARDASGGFVVVMVPDRAAGDEIVGEILQRMGWVRKHLVQDRKEVRGIVVLDEAPESLRYTAAAVAGTVAFKSYRVALSFDDIEI